MVHAMGPWRKGRGCLEGVAAHNIFPTYPRALFSV